MNSAANVVAALAALTARLPALAEARTLYGRPDAEGELTYQIVTTLLELARRVSELERLNAEQTGDGK